MATGVGSKFEKALKPVWAQQTKHFEQALTGIKWGSIGAVAAAGAGFYEVVKAGSAFEKQISANAAVSEASGKQLKKLEAQALKYGQATFYSATQAAEAQGELIKGGQSLGEVLGGGLPAALALAEAGELELAQAGETLVGVMSTFHIEGKESMAIANGLAKAANLTTGEVSDFAEAFKQGGGAVAAAGGDFNEGLTILEAMAKALNVKGSDAGTSMKTALVQLAEPIGRAKTLTEELNLQFFDQNGNLKSAAGLSKELTRVLKDKTGQERLSVTQTLAGTDGFRTLLSLYDLGPKKLRKYEKANEKQGYAQEVAAKKMDNFSGKWEAFKGSLETTEIQIYKGIAPALDTLAEEGEKAANRVGDIFANENLSTSQKLERSIDFIGGELGKLWDKAEIPEHAAEAFAAAAPVVAEAAGHTAVFAAEEFGKAFIHAPFIAKVAMAAWLTNFIGGRQAFVGIGKLYGKQFGAIFAQEAVAASVAAAIPEKIAAESAVSTLPVATPAAAKQSSFLGPGTGAARRAAVEGAAIHDAEMATSFLAIPDLGAALQPELKASGKSGSRAFLRSFAADIKTGAPQVLPAMSAFGGRLVQGAATWGLGGFVIGGLTKELAHGTTGQEIGNALQAAGVGAAIGNAIAPGVGTGVGAGIGAALSQLAGEKLGERPDREKELHLKGLEFNVETGRSEAQFLSLERAFAKTMAKLRADASLGMGAINKALGTGLDQANETWAHGTPKWRAHTISAMQAAVKEIQQGMDAGTVDAKEGQKEISRLLGRIHLTQGKDPFGLAKASVQQFQEAGKITSAGVADWTRRLGKMPEGARKTTIDTTTAMLDAWAQGHPKLEAQVDNLTQYEIRKFGTAGTTVAQAQQQAMQHIVELNTGASSSVAQALTNIGGNLTSALKALGAHNLVEFKITQEASAFHHRQTGGSIPGTFMVPGSGSGDKVPMMLPAGSFIENREAAKQPLAFQRGGLTPVMLEPGERGWLPEAVKAVGAGNLHARNSAFPRFQTGGETGTSIPREKISGPEPLRSGAQNAVNQVWKGAAKYLAAHSEPQRVLKMLHAGEAITSRGFPYVYGGGHGSFAIQPVDCSGLVSYVLRAGNFISSPMSVQQGSGLYTLGASGPGKYFTWGVRGTSGANAHTMISVKRPGDKGWAFFESGGSGGGAHQDSGWDGSFQFRHMPGFQEGGQVGMPKKAQEAIAKFGQEAFNPKSDHFVGWGYQRGGFMPRLRSLRAARCHPRRASSSAPPPTAALRTMSRTRPMAPQGRPIRWPPNFPSPSWRWARPSEASSSGRR